MHPSVLAPNEVLLATLALALEATLTFFVALWWARRTVREG